MSEERIGVDESGKGDFFGPLVIAACFVAPWNYSELEGVCDSKKLTDKRALDLAKVIKKECPHEVVMIGPARYNEMYADIKNLNRLLAWGHAQAISKVLEKKECHLAISDQFADPKYLQSLLDRRGLKVTLVSQVRAESDLAVAAASVLARAEFLTRLKKLGEELEIPLPKGAGPEVDKTAARIIREKGESALTGVAKLHFKTVEKARVLAKGL